MIEKWDTISLSRWIWACHVGLVFMGLDWLVCMVKMRNPLQRYGWVGWIMWQMIVMTWDAPDAGLVDCIYLDNMSHPMFHGNILSSTPVNRT